MKYIVLLVFLSIWSVVKSQDTIVRYFDNDLKEVKISEAKYISRAYKVGFQKWKVDDFYLSGQLKMKGICLSKKLKKKDGKFTFFHENGRKEKEGVYKKGKNVGDWKWWNDNGNIRKKGQFNSKGEKIGYWKSWYSNGNIDKEGEYSRDKYNNEWKWYFKNGQISSKEIYNNGELLSYQFWNEDGSKVKDYEKFEVMPEYPGGETALMAYIGENVVYPEEAISSMITGRVYISFVVSTTGEVENVKVARGAHPLLDVEAIRIVAQMPEWKNGKQHNRPVKVSYAIPINFYFK